MQTATDILSVLEGWAREKRPIAPDEYVEAAMKLTLLMGEESNLLFLLESKIADMRVGWIEQGKSVAEAKLRTEATPEYREARNQKAKIERITEIARLSKLRARLASDEYKVQ